MGELINVQRRSERLRRNLLANVSALALLGTAFVPAMADGDRPTVWIDLGGQLERVDSSQAIVTPAFFDLASPNVLKSLVGAQRPSRYATGAEGKISLMPQGTNWVFSAAVRYGRVKNNRHLHYQTPGLPTFINIHHSPGVSYQTIKPRLRQFGDGQANLSETHFVLDFQAGKDVGLGLFGANGSSVFNAGVRYAQFTSRSDMTLHARPVLGYGPLLRVPVFASKYQLIHPAYHQSYTAIAHATRSTHGVGPSVSWNASMPVAGRDGTTVSFDWGANASVLFGRQRASTHHQTAGDNFHQTNVSGGTHVTYAARPPDQHRSHAVTIPNVGGFAGVSLKFPNAKVSLGYRGDFFFNVTDSGVDVRDITKQNFYGPFATISIGLGG